MWVAFVFFKRAHVDECKREWTTRNVRFKFRAFLFINHIRGAATLGGGTEIPQTRNVKVTGQTRGEVFQQKPKTLDRGGKKTVVSPQTKAKYKKTQQESRQGRSGGGGGWGGVWS